MEEVSWPRAKNTTKKLTDDVLDRKTSPPGSTQRHRRHRSRKNRRQITPRPDAPSRKLIPRLFQV
jgi:hypothetical protein